MQTVFQCPQINCHVYLLLQAAEESEEVKPQKEPVPERTQSGRAKRLSAQVAGFYLREIASEELLKEWPKRKVQRDLVPDDRKVLQNIHIRLCGNMLHFQGCEAVRTCVKLVLVTLHASGVIKRLIENHTRV